MGSLPAVHRTAPPYLSPFVGIPLLIPGRENRIPLTRATQAVKLGVTFGDESINSLSSLWSGTVDRRQIGKGFLSKIR